MNSPKNMVTQLYDLPTCYIYERGTYKLVANSEQRLPMFCKNKIEMFENFGIPYRRSSLYYDCDGYYEVWDPSFYEEEILRMPLFCGNSYNEFTYKGMHEESVPSKETIEKAKEYVKKCIKPLLNQNGEEEEKILKALKKRKDKVLALMEKKQGTYALDYYRYCQNYLPENIKIMRVKRIYNAVLEENEEYSFTPYIVIFNTDNFEEGEEIILEVKKGKEGIFVGNGGWQVKKWSQELGVKKINVVGV